MSDAIVVGSGPNGLAAAVELARNGLDVTVLEAAEEIGGGTRSAELTVPGVLHDVCSGVHPMGIGSPYLKGLGLDRHGLEWALPEIDIAHPLDDGTAVAVRSLKETAAGLGADGRTWERLFGPLAAGFDRLAEDVMGPILRVPSHPVRLAGFGLRALPPATVLARALRTPRARALFAGVAAHHYAPLSAPASSAIGALMIGAVHRVGWPVPVGGSRMISRSLASLLAEHGGKIETGVRVGSLDELGRARTIILDLAPRDVVRLAGDRLPAAVRRSYLRYRHGPAAYKLDLAVQGGVPWRDEACRKAVTLHLGGTIEEIADAERRMWRGEMPERPFVLVAQQYLADPSRSAGDVHPIYAYAHVPAGYAGDGTEAILRQIERFAPGVRERIVGMAATPPAAFAEHNANYLGGDILTGANTLRQIVLRPRPALNPYATGVPGVFLCSAATPPGAGVHGMGGYHAARAALRAR
ncbi:NAD(P)/FAD-dependent oxidoreductase [Actinocorallia longicatena]|uniref:NAD(P)/FAD-dependent oxidoreductase n=1 Tax=Actinocorallia longicatena TaxID=111803 RepID=A0ABP6Q9C2_9ACTN